MKLNLMEVGDDLIERKVGTLNRKTERGVFLGFVGAADKRYGRGKWRAKIGDRNAMFGAYIVADDGRCLSVSPA